MNLPACIAATCLLAAATAQDPSPEGQALGAAPIKLDGVGDDYRISVALGDLDGDGVEDLVIGRNGSFDVRRGLSRKPRRFAAARSLGVKAGPTCENACEPRLVDVDQDGDLDLLTLCAGEAIGVNAAPVWFANDGAGAFGARTELLAVGGEALPRNGSRGVVELVDWDGDGVRDLLFSTPRLVLHRGVAGGFAAEGQWIGPQGRGFAVVDWDGDGDLDLVTQDRRKVVAHTRDGGGLGARVVAELAAPYVPMRIAVADWDLDGKADLLLGNHERTPKLDLPKAVLAAEREQVRAAQRVLDVVHKQLLELNQSRPPLDDPEAMRRRKQWREELQGWSKAPQALIERLGKRRRQATQPQYAGIVQVVRQ